MSNIITINQLKTKAVIKDVARVFEKDFAFANNLTKLVPQEPGQAHHRRSRPCEQSEKLRELYETDPEVKNILDISARLEGLARNTGRPRRRGHHRPGRPHPFAPLARDKDGKVMVQYTMIEAERAGLLKMDFLGLETLTQIAKTQELHRQDPGPADGHDGHPHLRRQEDLRPVRPGDTDGIFQFESGGMKQLLRKLRARPLRRPHRPERPVPPGPAGRGHGRRPTWTAAMAGSGHLHVPGPWSRSWPPPTA